MLFGALLIAPASTFVGCSDYDDDISSLQQQIDVNKSTLNDLLAEKVNDIQSQLEALKKADSDLDAAFKDADAALKQAQEAGDKAVLDKVASEYATVAAAKELVANAKDELQKALDSKAEELIAKDAELTEGVSAAKAAAAAAQATADQALALAQEASDLAQKNADAIKAVNGELDTQAAKLEDLSSKLDAQATKLGELSTKIDEVKSSLEAQISSLSDEINGKLDEVNGKIAGINGQIAALEAFKTAQEGTNTDLQNQIDALVKELNDVKGYLENKLRVQIEGMIGDAEARIMESVDANKATIAELKSNYDEQFRLLKERMDKVEAAIGELNDTTIPGINDRIDNLNTDINTLRTTLSNVLRSIVFKPELYVGGIESQEYPYMHYAYQTRDDNNTNNPSEGDMVGAVVNGANVMTHFVLPEDRSIWAYKDDSREGNASYAIAVKYHLNPSSAQIPFGDLSFLSDNVDIINRASSEAPKTADAFYAGVNAGVNETASIAYNKSANSGVLTVGMKVDAGKLHTLYNGGEPNVKQGSIFALQAKVDPEKGENTTQTITSDYAQLYASQIKPLAIAFNSTDFDGVDCAVTCDELYKVAATALESNPSVAISYKEYKEGSIDLASLFELHYDWYTKTKNEAHHAVMKNGAEGKFGLHYDFALVDYTAGTNNSHDSRYAAIVNNKLVVRRVDAQGNSVVPTTDEEAKAAIGRHPLVRVRLMEGNEVVLAGFFHVQIVENVENKEAAVYDFKNKEWTCDGFTGKVTWSHISEAVLSTCGLSREEFEALYELTTDNNNQAYQFVKSGSKYTKVDDTNKWMGIIKKVEDTQGGVATSVLKWVLTGKNLQAIYDNTNHTYTVYVQFKRKNSGYNSLEGHIYFPMKITVTKPQIPTISAQGNENWDANNVFAINVGQPRPKDASGVAQLIKISQYFSTDPNKVKNNGEYNVLWSDLDYAWMNGKPEWEITSPTTSPNYYVAHDTDNDPNGNGSGPNTGYKYYFVPVKGDGFVYKTTTGKIVTSDNVPGSAQILMDNKLGGDKLKPNLNTRDYVYKYNDDNVYNPSNPTSPTKVGNVFNCNEIYSNGVLICTLNQNNGQVIWNMAADEAKKVLNANSETKFKVGMVTEHVNNCDVALPLLYNGSLAMFDFKVQRPITVSIANGPAEVIDAETTTYDIPLANYLVFTDWRNVNFWNDLHLFYFYEISDIKIDADNILADINKPNKKYEELDKLDDRLDAVKPEVHIDLSGVRLPVVSKNPTRPALDEKLGKITYRTNTGASVTKGYNIYVPIYVKYALSANNDMSLKTILKIHINPSYQQP